MSDVRKDILRPLDVGVALFLLLHPDRPYADIGASLGVTKSTAHLAVRRLARRGLVSVASAGALGANAGALREFLSFGIVYVFPLELLGRARGVPTGFSAPMLSKSLVASGEPHVWPSRLGDVLGQGIEPLVPAAPEISFRDPELYEALALVDAVRGGDARTREVARERLAEFLARPDR